MAINKLSATQIKKAVAKEKEYNLKDGGGLILRVKPNGSKNWILNYTNPINWKLTNAGLGSYPNISLERARQPRQEYKSLTSNGINRYYVANAQDFTYIKSAYFVNNKST